MRPLLNITSWYLIKICVNELWCCTVVLRAESEPPKANGSESDETRSGRVVIIKDEREGWCER